MYFFTKFDLCYTLKGFVTSLSFVIISYFATTGISIYLILSAFGLRQICLFATNKILRFYNSMYFCCPIK